MIEVGSFIKLQRRKKDMTLAELAEGIVSVSYLSKIENLKTDASEDIIKLLCDRLDIQLENDMEVTLKEKCDKWYKMLFYNHNQQETIETYNELQLLFDRNLSKSLLLFEIYKIRYFLIIDDRQSALDQIKELNKMQRSFDTEELYYWYKIRGNYNSSVGENTKALEKYLKAEELIRKLDVTPDEMADLQYTISITYSRLRQILESIDYANKALDIFMKNYNFLRCAQCHIVLGISYRRLKMYDKAIKNYNLAKHLAELDNNRDIIQLTNQNLGYLYATQGNSNEAIKYFTEVAEVAGGNVQEKLSSLTELIKVHYEIGNVEKANKLTKEALKLLKQHPKKDEAYEFYDYVIHTYFYMINNEKDKFSVLVKDRFIPFLKRHKDHANLGTFATILAEHYESIRRYKDAAKYYKLASHSYKELSNI